MKERKKWIKIGSLLLILAVLQYVVVGIILTKLYDLGWIERLSSFVSVGLFGGGLGAILQSRSDKIYKKHIIEEQDERNRQIIGIAASVAYYVLLVSECLVYSYIIWFIKLTIAQRLIIISPIFISIVVGGVVISYLKRKM